MVQGNKKSKCIVCFFELNFVCLPIIIKLIVTCLMSYLVLETVSKADGAGEISGQTGSLN